MIQTVEQVGAVVGVVVYVVSLVLLMVQRRRERRYIERLEMKVRRERDRRGTR